MKLRYLIFIPMIFVLTLANAAAEGTCAIDGKMSPKLAEYIKGVNELSTKLKQLPSSCGDGKNTNGIISNTRKTLDTIEKAKVKIPIMDNLTLDFDYTIKMAFKGESRVAVIENGKIFTQAERVLYTTIDVLASKCNLNETNESLITERIVLNDALANLYKETALGYPGVDPKGISAEFEPVANEIRSTYNPTATLGCKNELPFEKFVEEIMNKIVNMSFGIEKNLGDWKYAIALLRGGSGIKQEEYSNLKKRLLTEELRRQGYSAGAIDQMVKGYNCVESAMLGDDGNVPMDFAQAKSMCARISILGVDRFMKEWDRMLLGSKGAQNIVNYLNRSVTYTSVREQNIETAQLYTELSASFNKDMDLNDDFLSTFINLHINIIDMNDRIKKRIDPMITNCKKAQPGISCNF